eukprot:jgi/Chrzof1/7812/Cz02g37140.t1
MRQRGLSGEARTALSTSSDLAKRPGYGQVGRQVNVFVNFFRISTIVERLHQYDIEFELTNARRPESRTDVQAGKVLDMCPL